jgi:hypothetical protein
LRLEAINAGICSVWFCHNSADTTSYALGYQKLCVSNRHTAMFVDVTCDCNIVFVVTHFVFELLLPVNLWFEQNIIVAFDLFVINLHTLP